jgi:hypothetical protein
VDNFGSVSAGLSSVVRMSYVAIDPAAVAALASSLDAAADACDSSRASVSRTLSSVGRTSVAPARLGAVASSARAAAADLRRRLGELRELQVLYRRTGEQGPVYPMSSTVFPTYEAAAAAGSALAREFLAAAESSDTFYDASAMRSLLDRLAPHADDPHFTKAFVDAMPPVLTLVWISQIGELSKQRDFPYREDAIAPFLTSLSTGLNASPAALRRYLGPLSEGLTPAEVRDVLNYGDYSDDVVLSLTLAAVSRAREGVHGMDWWEDEPGLFDAASRSPELASRLISALDEDALRDLLATTYGVTSGFGSVVSAASSSRSTVESLVALLARSDQRLADDVQVGLAYGIGEHFESFGDRVARGLYVGETSSEDLVRVLVRVMDENDAAVSVLHESGAEAAARLLRSSRAFTPGSPSVAALGGIFGLLARANASSAISDAERRARLYALGSQAVGLLPLPGPPLAGAAAKKAFTALVDSYASSARARGQAGAIAFTDDGYEHGRLLLALALAGQDDRPGAPLAPPRVLLRADGTLKVFADLDTAKEQDALVEWLSRPTPWPVSDLSGPRPGTLDEVVRGLDDEYVAAFDKFYRRPVK